MDTLTKVLKIAAVVIGFYVGGYIVGYCTTYAILEGVNNGF